MPEIAEGVKAIIAEVLGWSPERVTVDAELVEDLGADTLDRVEIAMEIEADFAICICGPAYLQCATVGALAGFVETRLREMGKLS